MLEAMKGELAREEVVSGNKLHLVMLEAMKGELAGEELLMSVYSTVVSGASFIL